MNCEQFRIRIHDRVRGTLSGEQEAELSTHGEECSECSDFEAAFGELTCKEFVDFLHAYIDKELPTERALVFDRHLALCPDCTAYLDSYRKTMSLSVSAMTRLSEELPEKIPTALVQAILDARKKSK